MHKKLRMLALVGLLIVTGAAGVHPAQATTTEESSVQLESESEIEWYDPSTMTLEDTLVGIVPPDKNPTESTTAACGRMNYGYAPRGTWGNIQHGSCAIWGDSGIDYGRPAYVSYSWAVQPGTIHGVTVCAQAFGYARTVRVEIWDPPAKTVKRWYNAGCGSSGRVTVPWGNVSDVKKMRFLGTQVPGLGASVGFHG